MAKKEEASKTVLERTYVIPLASETIKAPHYRKAKKAVTAVRGFIIKHMKSENVKIGKYLNLQIWEHGIRNPPRKVKVIATKDDKGKVFVELVDAPKEEPKAEEKKKPAKKEEAKPEDKLEKQAEEKKEEKAEEARKIEQEEIKELKKEVPKHHAPKAPMQPKVQQQHPTAPKSV